MEWLNIHTSTLDSAEFLGESPEVQGTWLKLMHFCAKSENGGVIKGVRTWKDRKLEYIIRVTHAEIGQECELWTWDGDDLSVNFYPVQKEAEVKANRINGKKGGRPRKPDKTEEKNHPVNPTETTRPKIAETEGKGMEGNGMEGKESKPGARALNASQSLESVTAWIQTIRPAWKLPFTPVEADALAASFPTFAGLDDDDREMVAGYMSAKLERGVKQYRPTSRERFILGIADIFSHAFTWNQRNNRPKASPKNSPTPAPPPKPLTADERAELAAWVKETKAMTGKSPQPA